MLGHTLLRVAQEERTAVVTGAVRSIEHLACLSAAGFDAVRCDIADPASVRRVLAADFDAVINAAGVTKVRAIDEAATMRINGEAPHVLADICTERGLRLVHVSTDCVFSGSRGQYSEADVPDADDVYGRSKLAGEVVRDGHLTVRTSFVGREIFTAHGLLEWFLSQRGVVRGYRRVFWSGVTTVVLSRVLLLLGSRCDVSGILHVASERIDKCSLLHLLAEAYYRRDVEVVPVDEPALDRSLDASRSRAIGIEVPDPRSMMLDFARGIYGSGRLSRSQPTT
jgi:dTDP-4-dehydrorhamnose reductase